MTHWMLIGAIVLIVLLLLFSALFSISETALTAASKARINRLESEGVKRAKSVSVLIHNRERLLGALLLGNSLANISVSAIATTLLVHAFGDAGVVIATFGVTALVLIFVEVLPKTYAIVAPERTALSVAPSIRLFVWIFGPIVTAVQAIVRGTFRIFGVKIDEQQDLFSAHEEIRSQIDLHHQTGEVVKRERDMLGGILDLADLQVSEVMVHRKSIETVDADLTPAEIVSFALKSLHTRLPLYRDNPDNIVGVLHAKDLLRAIAQAGGRIDRLDIRALARKPWFVPETTPVREQLNAFLRRRNHFALVVDEYGALMGLVTLEDILEEIVGEIDDEYDVKSAGIRPQADGAVNVDGSVAIRDLNRTMDWSLPDEEATTIAGLVIHEAQTIPEPGQVFSFHGFKFEILRKQRNQITAIRVTRLVSSQTAA